MPKVIIKDNTGAVLGKFQAEKGQTLTDGAAKNQLEIPVSCGMGACGICKCIIEEGLEHIDKDMTGTGVLPLADGHVLACIAGIKDDAFDMLDDPVQIVVRRMF